MVSSDSGRKVAGGRLTPKRRRILDRLLDQTLALPDEKRAAYVQQCCERAPRLGFWLERLMMASAEPEAFIDNSARHLAAGALAARTDLFPRTLVQGTRFGPWRILSRIGAGGMGEVYHAERADGTFEMQVAIKLIRSRKKDLARMLESERQLMARLNHPSIARLIDGGLADDDRPYLVMEWVDGRTLGEWAPQKGISTDRFLSVFSGICEAVAFAHRSLVIHGDIKPANLAISRDGQVKLLDFGVAQILDSEGASHSPSALTPGFAAPEQLAGEQVSTVTDIYSLGALLHWLVFGKAPEGEGSRTEKRPVWREFRRMPDLLAIINKATANDPEHRYATVNAMLQDLKRLQSGHPVTARHARPWEHLALWVRRRKLAATFGAAAALALIFGVSAIAWQARVVAQERDVARHEAMLSLAVKDHLVLLFREVSSLSDDARQLTARELLDATAEAANEWLKDDPVTQAEIQLAIAEILISLDDYASAAPMLEKVLAHLDERSSPALAAKLYRNMGLVLHRRGDINGGFEMATKAVGMIEAFSGDHRERLSDALQIRARLARERGDWQGSVDDLHRARRLAQAAAEGPRPVLARAEANLAANYVRGGDFHRAVEHMEAAEALWYALGRAESPDALANLQNLALVLDRIGRTEEAESRFLSGIAIRTERLGHSGALAAAQLHFGRMMIVSGRFDEAEAMIRPARDMMARFVGESTPDFASTEIGLGDLEQARGQSQLAAEHYATAEKVFLDALGETHPYTLLARAIKLGALYRADGSDPEASFEIVIDRLEQSGPSARAILAQVYCERSVWLLMEGRAAAAEQDAAQCHDMRTALSLGGWRVFEAEALQLLARAENGSAEARDKFETVLARLGEHMSSENDRFRWLRQHGDRL
jgi:tetratricopeptide (TPR) repeat protein